LRAFTEKTTNCKNSEDSNRNAYSVFLQKAFSVALEVGSALYCHHISLSFSSAYHYVEISEDVQIEPVRGIIRVEGLEAVQNNPQTR